MFLSYRDLQSPTLRRKFSAPFFGEFERFGLSFASHYYPTTGYGDEVSLHTTHKPRHQNAPLHLLVKAPTSSEPLHNLIRRFCRAIAS